MKAKTGEEFTGFLKTYSSFYPPTTEKEVKYLDETTKAMQLSQYELILEKDTNWMIFE